MKVAIFAVLTTAQYDYLRDLTERENINCQFVVEGDNSPILPSLYSCATPAWTSILPVRPNSLSTATPLTGEMLQAAATDADMSVIQVAQKVAELGISTVEEALAHSEIPAAVKRVLEDCL